MEYVDEGVAKTGKTGNRFLNCTIKKWPKDYPKGRPGFFLCPMKYENSVRCCGLYRCCPGAGPKDSATPGTVVLFTWITILVTLLLSLIVFILVKCFMKKKRESGLQFAVDSTQSSDTGLFSLLTSKYPKEMTVCYVEEEKHDHADEKHFKDAHGHHGDDGVRRRKPHEEHARGQSPKREDERKHMEHQNERRHDEKRDRGAYVQNHGADKGYDREGRDQRKEIDGKPRGVRIRSPNKGKDARGLRLHPDSDADKETKKKREDVKRILNEKYKLIE